MREEAIFYQLGDDGYYHAGGIDSDGVYRSAVISGFWLRVEWLWQNPLPPVLRIVKELGVL